MKKFMKGLASLMLALTLSTGVVDAATQTRKIDASACDTVYTNYYFFLEANTAGFFNKYPNLTSIYTSNIAKYSNNSYQVSNFDQYNIGYGQIAIDKYTTTSKDGITSMSLYDFYSVLLNSKLGYNGTFTLGTKKYIVTHDWYSIDTNTNTLYEHFKGLDNSSSTIQSMINATVNANSTITLNSTVSPYAQNPFNIRIDRNYYGYTTGMPNRINDQNWYYHPAVFYVQYCSPKTTVQPAPTEYYNVYYRSRTNDVVTDMPGDTKHKTTENMTISKSIPKRAGYTFVGWTTDSAGQVANPLYGPGVTYSDRKELVLYAVWQKDKEEPTNPIIPDNPQTGISDYLIPFGGVISASGIALGILKKKKGFKQF